MVTDSETIATMRMQSSHTSGIIIMTEKKADDRSHTGQQPQQEKSHRKNGAKSDHRRPDERPEKLDVGFCVQFRMFHHRHGVQAFQQGLRAFFAHQRNQHRQGVTPAAVAGTADVQRDHAENLHHQVLPQVGER